MDFKFLQDENSKKWVISAPRRAKRPNISKGTQAPVCPFCPGGEEEELFRVGGNPGDNNWTVRVLKNKFPFAPVHEIIVHSPDHHKTFDELPSDQVERILEVFKDRFNKFRSSGQVYIFTNSGEQAGESIPHPHTQLVVIPEEVELDIPMLPQNRGEELATDFFSLFCPSLSDWPDEVWIAPKRREIYFGDIYPEEIIDLGFVIQRLIQIMDIRHGNEFPFNTYIYPGKDWYMRLVPRSKILGGFEVGTKVFVNTQDPKNTFEFLKIHFQDPDEDLILKEHMAEYGRGV